MVDAIWSELGLQYPPKVEPLPRQARRLQGDGSRLRLRLPAVIPSWLLLHELAHALSSAEDGVSDKHGPDFMGLYVQLLARYPRLPAAGLIQSAIAGRRQGQPEPADRRPRSATADVSTRHARIRDRQQTRVYAWEDAFDQHQRVAGRTLRGDGSFPRRVVGR